MGVGIGRKAGKILYPTLVGEGSSLYKTFKSPLGHPLVVDLHGLSAEQALEILNSNLPVWMETAMKGDYPWVIPVNIVCGGGSQILSDVVQHWIRESRQVANRPKA